MAHLSGLDGLRALAVIGVLLYHSGVLPGGFLGVEIFFVISGFLITLLLLEELQARGRIALREFWLKRARRLLPASFVMIAVTLTWVAILLPDEVAAVRGAALAGVLSVSNWYSVFAQQSYFESVRRPPMLLHLWSLGIEAQFYAVWPVVVWFGLWRLRRAYQVGIVVVAAAASALLMAARYQPLGDSSTLYYETDTRATGLLLGCALALGWSFLREGRRVPRWLLDALGVAALSALVCLVIRLNELDPLLYLGGFSAVGLATILAITAAVHPRGRLVAFLLDRQPLSWIGTRSYAIYLWHWPIFQVTRPELDLPLDGFSLALVRLVLVGIVAELSYRYVEMPARRGMLGRMWAWRRTRRAGLAVPVLLGAIVLGTSVAAARPSERPSYLPVDTVDTWDSVVPLTQDESAPPELTPVPEPPPARELAPDPIAPAEPVLIKASAPLRVTAIGDSVMLGAVRALEAEIDGIQVDAAVSRQVATAIDILRTHAAAGDLGDVVVVHVGVNGTFTAGQFDELMDVLAAVRRVVIVNVRVPRSWEAPNNATLAEGVQRYANAVLVDWHEASKDRRELFWDDGIHLRPEGADLYASLIADALQ